MHKNHYLPTTKSELQQLGWDYVDIVIVSGDAYVDHPAFAAAIIGRNLEAAGFRVGIIDQPDWQNPQDFLRLGLPRLYWAISSGNMDSMVNHYTAQKKLRHNDAYTAGGAFGKRPDRALIIYANVLRRISKGIPIIIGGIEASLRRICHYDYWSDSIRNSILADAKADLLVYGMGEKTAISIAKSLREGSKIADLDVLPGTVVFSKTVSEDGVLLPDSDQCHKADVFYRMTKMFEEHRQTGTLFQRNGGRLLKHNPAPDLPTTDELDSFYTAQYNYLPHPKYGALEIPAFVQIRNSLTSHRGCYGGCNFCAIVAHQGRAICSRSQASLLNEADRLSKDLCFGGTISDVGGPTANMYGTFCKIGFPASCKRPSCLYPALCPNLMTDQSSYAKLLSRMADKPSVKNVFIASGIRHDLALADKGIIPKLVPKHTGGRLKLAPEHISKVVLEAMGKPRIDSYEEFSKIFANICQAQKISRQIIPYLIIGHPGTTLEAAIELGIWLKRNKIRVEQVQEFTPTPMTISTCMYFTKQDFNSGAAITVPQGRQIRLQKALAMWQDKSFQSLRIEALKLAKREDLIPFFAK